MTQALIVQHAAPLVARTRRMALTPFAFVAIAAWWVTLCMPLSILTAMLAASVIAIAATIPNATSLRELFEEHRIAYARNERREARASRLSPTSFGQGTLVELTRLVDQIEARAPELAMRFDLEALLDRHVTLTLAYERALEAVQMANRAQLERMRDTYKTDPVANPKRIAMCDRRLTCLEECEAKAEALADDLAVLGELVKLIAQRAALREPVETDDIVERQLEELDIAEAADRQVANLP